MLKKVSQRQEIKTILTFLIYFRISTIIRIHRKIRPNKANPHLNEIFTKIFRIFLQPRQILGGVGVGVGGRVLYAVRTKRERE